MTAEEINNQPDPELENNQPDPDAVNKPPKPEEENNPPDPEPEKITGYDPKNREVICSFTKGCFKVEKPSTGFFKTKIKSPKKAKEIFDEQVNSSQN
jgi:hypothetical protein